ncbi:MAG: glycosyltransferase family 39 protein [Pseudorhodobacter sp.]|nr:glycosyltransferase family 39 protein [Pseudorhodobacter sp.]
MLSLDRTELYVDEAQYWLWGQEMAFGAHSKPPLIGWLIRSVTEVVGDAGTFSVRLAAPLLHGITAVLVMALARTLTTPGVAAAAGLGYLTLPAVTLGSAMMTTDTPMLTCLAASLLIWRHMALRWQGGGLANRCRSWPLAVALGFALGLGLVAKYAIVYAVVALAVTALVARDWRIAPKDALVAGTVAFAVLAPNLYWNATHGFATFHELIDETRWSGLQLFPDRALRFLAEQFAVMGPIMFAAFMAAVLVPGRLLPEGAVRGLMPLALPILAIVTLQALFTRALANWGVGFLLAGSIVATIILARHMRGLLVVSLVLGLALALALPVLTVVGLELRLPNGDLALKRYIGRAEISQRVLAIAEAERLETIVAEDRALLADLRYQVRGGGPAIRALAHAARAENHYALLYPLQPADLESGVLYLAFADDVVPCRAASGPVVLDRWLAGPGWAEGRELVALWVGADCWPDGSADVR